MIRPVILANCLIKQDNKFLLVQEGTDKIMEGINTHSRGKWGLPHGQVDPQQTLIAAAKRELLEETGGQAQIEGLLAVVQAMGNNTIQVLSFVFYGHSFEHIQQRWEDEIQDTAWMTADEIRELQANNQIRSNYPLDKIMKIVERKQLQGNVKDKLKLSASELIIWQFPDYMVEVFERLNNKT